MDALDPNELDVRGRGRARDEDDRPALRAVGARRSISSGTVSTTCSARTTQTCRSGTSVIARRPWPSAAVERDRPGVRAGRGTGRHGAVDRVERDGREVVVLHDLDPGRARSARAGRGRRRPARRPRLRAPRTPPSARRGATTVAPSLLDALDEERHHVRRGPRPALAVGARHVGRSRAVRQRGANPRRGRPHASRSRASHHSRNVWSATPGSVARAPPAGERAGHPAEPAVAQRGTLEHAGEPLRALVALRARECAPEGVQRPPSSPGVLPRTTFPRSCTRIAGCRSRPGRRRHRRRRASRRRAATPRRRARP